MLADLETNVQVHSHSSSSAAAGDSQANANCNASSQSMSGDLVVVVVRFENLQTPKNTKTLSESESSWSTVCFQEITGTNINKIQLNLVLQLIDPKWSSLSLSVAEDGNGASVEFHSVADAGKAVSRLDGSMLLGDALHVKVRREEKDEKVFGNFSLVFPPQSEHSIGVSVQTSK